MTPLIVATLSGALFGAVAGAIVVTFGLLTIPNEPTFPPRTNTFAAAVLGVCITLGALTSAGIVYTAPQCPATTTIVYLESRNAQPQCLPTRDLANLSRTL